MSHEEIRAVYHGYQQGFEGFPGFFLFHLVCPGHPQHESTLGLRTFIELGVTPEDFPIEEIILEVARNKTSYEAVQK